MDRMLFLVLFSLAAHTIAVVELTYSQLFDHVDFVGKSEVPLTRCIQGCVVFAAAPAESNIQTHSYQTDIVLVRMLANGTYQTISSLREIAHQYSQDPKQPFLRIGVTLSPGAQYAFVNRAGASPHPIGALAIYAVSTNIPNLPIPTNIPVYDIPDNGEELFKIFDYGQAFTILSTPPFTITPLAMIEGKNLTIRTTGFDAVMDPQCKPLYEAYLPRVAYSLRIPVRSPLLTVSWANAEPYAVYLKRGVAESVRLEAGDVSFVTSAGYIGCSGVENFRTVPNDNVHPTVVFESDEVIIASATVHHALQQEDYVAVMLSHGSHMYNGKKGDGWDSFKMEEMMPMVSWTSYNPRSQWSVMLQSHNYLSDPPASLAPTSAPATPIPESSTKTSMATIPPVTTPLTNATATSTMPERTTKAASATQVMLLALVAMLGATSALH